MICVNDLSVRVRGNVLLNSLNCTLPNGRLTTFIGKSGAGKTTLLRSMAGLIPIPPGAITLDGENLQGAGRVGFVFQDFNLFPHLSVLENCIDPLVAQGKVRKDVEAWVISVLEEFGLKNFVKAYPYQLSGGQQQRLAIARALCLKPDALLLDEPTASLDPENTDILVSIVRRLAREGLTVGLTSQDMSFVRKIFDRVYFIEQGSVVEFCDGLENLESCPQIRAFLCIDKEAF